MKLPVSLEVYFWDVSVNELNFDKHRIFIISRILNEGNHRAVAWLFDVYDRETIKGAVKTSRSLSLKTARCWQNYFDLKEEEFCCAGLHSAKNERLY